MIIRATEHVEIGSFGKHADGTQKTAALNFARIVGERLTEYCEKNYPAAEIEFDLSVEDVSGCCQDFNCDCDDIKIEKNITQEYEGICASLARSGEIYE